MRPQVQRHVDLVHVTGNQNLREAARAFNEIGVLSRLWTTVGFPEASKWLRHMRPIAARLERRSYPQVNRAQLRTSPVPEAVRNLLLSTPLSVARRQAGPAGRFGIDWVMTTFDRSTARGLARQNLDIVYSYLGRTHQVAIAAARHGAQLVVEAEHAHWRTHRAILSDEIDRNPEWFESDDGIRSFERDEQWQQTSLELADVIVAPSAQVAESIWSERPDVEISLIPYGCPPVADRPPHRWDRRRPLKVLYVGRLGPTKGIADLARATSAFKGDIELTIIGGRETTSRPLEQLLARSNYLGTVSRPEVLNAMDTSDVLIAPSLVEGRSLSVLESVSRGLPVIVTPGTGTEDLFTEGGGFVVPCRAPSRIPELIEGILSGTYSVESLSEQSQRIAASNPWNVYRSGLQALVDTMSTGTRSP